MSINNETAKEMASAIIIAANQIVKNAKFDRTFKGRVTTILGNNKYIVSTNGKEFTVKCPHTLKFQEVVHVTALENNIDNLIVTPSAVNTNFTPHKKNIFNNTDLNGILSYPISPGLYRVISGNIVGLPANNIGYGALSIINCGVYTMHIYIDANSDMFYARTDGVITPTSWKLATSTTVASNT